MKPILIGLAGRAKSGKDTVASIIKSQINKRGYGVKTIAFAAPLKRIVQELYAFDDQQMTQHDLKEAGDKRYPRPDGTFLSPREAMQILGTEFGRRCYPNTWIDFGIRQAKKAMKPDNHFNAEAAGVSVVFTDCRFINEAKAILDIGGEVWRIRRPLADELPGMHASETEMDSAEFCRLVTHVVHNDEGLEQLIHEVKRLIT